MEKIKFTESTWSIVSSAKDKHELGEVTRFNLLLSLIENPDNYQMERMVELDIPISDIYEILTFEAAKGVGDQDGIVEFSADEVIDSYWIMAKILENKSGFIYNLFVRLGVNVESYLNSLSNEDEVEEEGEDEEELVAHVGFSRSRQENPEGYLENLIEKALSGNLPEVFCRDPEIERVVKTLGRKGKNNPVLVGEAGTGKSTIVYGLAHKIAKGEVPDYLKNKVIYEANVFSLLAGTKWRGEFEEKVKRIVDFLKSQGRDAILFIDEIHTIVGAGSSEDSGDMSNMIKPALSKGEITCIGATTISEYQKYIEKDPALERRFQKVIVKEPSVEDCKKMIAGIKPSFEKHYGIKISNQMVDHIVETVSTLKERKYPDKAIDLLDESCSEARIRIKPRKNKAKDKKAGEIDVLIELANCSERPLEALYFCKKKDDLASGNKPKLKLEKKHIDAAYSFMSESSSRGSIGF